MFHFYIFFYIVSFAVGIAAIALFTLLYAKTKSRLVKYNIAFLSFSTLYMIIALFRGYLVTYVQISIQVRIATYLLYYVVIALGLFIIPRFFHSLTQSEYKRGFRIFWNSTMIAQPVMVIIPFILGNTLEETNYILIWQFRFINNNLFLLMIVYCLIVSFYYYRSITQDYIRLVLKTIFIGTIVFIPGLIYDIVSTNIELINKEQYPFFFFRLYYFVWNAANIILLFVYFHKRINLTSSVSHISEAFITEYLITTREKEIIGHLMKKHTYSEIGSKLFISPKTVERHISNIYRKTRSENREDLLKRIGSYL